MTYDELHGWVERGTAGVHSGAVVRDLGAEVESLRKLSVQALHDGYWWQDTPRRLRAQRLDELMRHHADMHETLHSMLLDLFRTESEERDVMRGTVRDYTMHKLATLAPYIAILRAGDAKRQRDLAEGRSEIIPWHSEAVRRTDPAPTFTTYAVDGDVLKINHNVQMPLLAQNINIRATIKGDE